MISTINKYIIRRTFAGLAIAAIVITTIIMLVDFVEGTRRFGSDESISSLYVFLLTLLKTPRLIEQTIPFIVLFGIMGTLSGLNKKSELIVLRAAGLSVWKFLTPVLLVTALLGVFWAFVFNPIANASDTARNTLLSHLKGDKFAVEILNKVWLREGTETGQLVILAKSVNPNTRVLHNVTFWVYENNEKNTPVFTYRMDAKTARWSPSYWQLSSVIENTALGEKSETEFLSWPTTLSYEAVFGESQKKNMLPFWKILSEIKKVKMAGFSTTSLQMQWQSLLVLPITLIAMALIAAGATLHLSRGGGTFRLLISGCILGFAVFFVENIIRAFGQSGSLPVFMAVWIVPFFVLFCSVAYLAKIEDG